MMKYTPTYPIATAPIIANNNPNNNADNADELNVLISSKYIIPSRTDMAIQNACINGMIKLAGYSLSPLLLCLIQYPAVPTNAAIVNHEYQSENDDGAALTT